MTLQLNKHLFSVDDYYKMGEVGLIKPSDRVELINGEIITMSPIKSLHSGIVDELFKMAIIASMNKFIVKAQNPIQLENNSEPQPDIVIAKLQGHKYQKRHPRPEDIYLLIEVADSSLKYDREIKVPLYAKAGILEYWIINLNEQQIEVFRQPEAEDYKFKKVFTLKEEVVCSTINLQIRLSDILAH